VTEEKQVLLAVFKGKFLQQAFQRPSLQVATAGCGQGGPRLFGESD
jgi:hypothetical protein